MAIIRVHNPVVLNPRSKPWTLKDAESRQSQAVRFAQDVLEDDSLADELEGLSPAQYAETRHKQIVRNPKRKRSGRNMKATISRRKSGKSGNGGNGIRRNQTTSSRVEADLLDQIDDLKAKYKKAQGQLDEISDALDCDDGECNAESHLDDIQDILDSNDNGNDDDD